MDGAGVFFVTKCLKERFKSPEKRNSLVKQLTDSNLKCGADIIVDTLCHMAEQNKIKIASFVVMPDHWHALFGIDYTKEVRGREPAPTLPKVMQSMNNWISKQCNLITCQKIEWQAGYYETRILSGKQFSYVCNYVESNPIRQKLVKNPESWKWNSRNKDFDQFLSRPWPWEFEK